MRLGDHVLHFEHEEDGQTVRALVFCEKCCSERQSLFPKSVLLGASSHETAFIGMFFKAMKEFEDQVPHDCEEAAKLVMCQEVLES